MKQPVLSYSTGNGYIVIGHASGIRSATAIVRRMVSVPAGAKLHVWERPQIMQEINGGPAGYVYAVSFGGK